MGGRGSGGMHWKRGGRGKGVWGGALEAPPTALATSSDRLPKRLWGRL